MSPSDRQALDEHIEHSLICTYGYVSIVQQACVQWPYRGYNTHHITVCKVWKRRKFRPVLLACSSIVTIDTVSGYTIRDVVTF